LVISLPPSSGRRTSPSMELGSGILPPTLPEEGGKEMTKGYRNCSARKQAGKFAETVRRRTTMAGGFKARRGFHDDAGFRSAGCGAQPASASLSANDRNGAPARSRTGPVRAAQALISVAGQVQSKALAACRAIELLPWPRRARRMCWPIRRSWSSRASSAC